MKNIQTLYTKRLILRPLNLDDTNRIVEIANEKEISRYTWYVPYPLTLPDAKKIVNDSSGSGKNEKELLRWGIISECHLIGVIDLYAIDKINKKAHLGYWIGKEFRRQRFAFEAIEAIIKYGFENLGLHKISAKTLADNFASNELLAKNGFRRAGVLEKDKLIDGEWADCHLWERLS